MTSGNELWSFLLLKTAELFYTVAAPLALAYLTMEVWLYLKKPGSIETFLQKYEGWQPLGAAIVGAIPGCGIDTAIIKMYGDGKVKLSVLVALSVTTLGDTIFFLLPQLPIFTFHLQLFLISLGLIASYLVRSVRVLDGVRSRKAVSAIENGATCQHDAGGEQKNTARIKPALILLFWAFSAAGTALMLLWRGGILSEQQLFQKTGIALALVGMTIFILFAAPFLSCKCLPVRFNDKILATTHQTGSLIFTIFWVVTAIEVLIKTAGFEVGPVANRIIIASLIGLIPNCGVQIAMATLFIEGKLNTAAFVANMVTQDGDGLIQLIKVAGWKPALILKIIRFALGVSVGYSYAWAIKYI